MKLRDKGKYPLEINDRIAATPDEAEEINLLTEKNNTLNQLNEALLQLNKEQQLCLTLFYLEKRSYTEIAADTGYSMMQVKSNIQNGKRNLRLSLKNKFHYNS
jgi:RNA polymerase sigma-70 factor (ECF subfamily)